jgi:hypothetical protein
MEVLEELASRGAHPLRALEAIRNATLRYIKATNALLGSKIMEKSK